MSATLYMELNADRMVAGAAKAGASLRAVQGEARAYGRAMEEAALSNQAYTLSVDVMTGELRRVPVTMAETSAAARTFETLLGTMGKKLTDAGAYAKSFAAHLKSMLIMGPLFAVLGEGLGLVERGIRSLFEPTEEETRRMEALAKATKEWKDQADRQTTLRAIAEGDRASGDRERYAKDVDEQLSNLDRLERAFRTGEAEPTHTVEDLRRIGVQLKDLESASQVFEDLERRTAAWRVELRKAIDTGSVVREDSITPLAPGTPTSAIENEVEKYRYGPAAEKLLPARPELYIGDQTLSEAFRKSREQIEGDNDAIEQGNDAIKARTALIEGLATAYNRMHGISAEGEKLFGTLATAGVPRDLAAGAARGVSRLQGYGGMGEVAEDEAAARDARARDQVEAARVARIEALQRAIDASENRVTAAQPGGERQLQLDNMRSLAESAGLAADQVDKVVAAEAGRLDTIDQLKAAEKEAAKVAQDRAQAISSTSNALGAGMSTFIDSLGSGGDAVRAFASSLANSLAQKGIDQLAASAATAFFSTPSPTTPSYQHGGYNPVTQMALLHAGERVLNPEQTRQYDAERTMRREARPSVNTTIHLHGISDAGGVRRSAYQLARQLERSQEKRA